MNFAKKKGTAAESAVVETLRTHGFRYAERRAGQGSHDRGDISGLPGVVIEVKNCREMDLAGWVHETEREREIATDLAVVWHKKRGKANPEEWYVTMTGAQFLAVLEGIYRLRRCPGRFNAP